MSFTVTETAVDNLVEVHATGKLTKEAYEEFVPMTEAKIRYFDHTDIEKAREWILE